MIIGKKNDLAYFDSLRGLVPCKVVRVYTNMHHEVRVDLRVTATRPGYQRGVVITADGNWAIPRPAVIRRKYDARILPYQWECED